MFVPFHFVEIVHRAQRSQAEALAGYRDLIVNEIDGLALRVGRLLREAKREAPDRFAEWVESELPFGAETAKRLMAISAAYEKLPPELVANLPRPWQALYALKCLPVDALAEGVARGELTQWTTVRRAKEYARERRGEPLTEGKVRRCDVAAAALMQFPASSLSPGIRAALERWLG